MGVIDESLTASAKQVKELVSAGEKDGSLTSEAVARVKELCQGEWGYTSWCCAMVAYFRKILYKKQRQEKTDAAGGG